MSSPSSSSPPPTIAVVAAVGAVTLTMLTLDLVFLGVVARGVYDAALGALKRPTVHWPAALAFYAMYVAAITVYGVLAARGPRHAFARGAGLGFVCYATYELTNWAVIAGWPAHLVPIDLAWGVALTGAASLSGRAAFERVAAAAR